MKLFMVLEELRNSLMILNYIRKLQVKYKVKRIQKLNTINENLSYTFSN